MKYKYFVSYAFPNGFGNIYIQLKYKLGKGDTNWIKSLNKEVTRLTSKENAVVLNYIRVY